jgi:hypothetical protein
MFEGNRRVEKESKFFSMKFCIDQNVNTRIYNTLHKVLC